MKKHLLSIMTVLAIAILLIVTGCEADPISVSSISLDKTEISLYPGTSEKLTATTAPADATVGTAITWSSDKAEIVSVDKEGNVKAVAVGEATITATTENGQKATCKVSVKPVETTEIKLSAEKLTLEKNGTADITVTFTPEDATDKTIIWSSDNETIAKVENGKVTALATGTATITAKTANGKEASCVVIVNPVPATSIALDKVTLDIYIGSEETLKATIEPVDATDKTVTWESSVPAVATVANGKITALTVGETVVTAKTANGKTATCTVKVNPILADSITLNKNTMEIYIGSEETLTATIDPANTTDKTVTWESSVPAVATVANGKIIALTAGNTTITAKTANGKEASCIVTVKAVVATSIKLSAETIVLEKGNSADLTVIFTPENTTDKTVTWESSVPAVATVENGKIAALTIGETVVTAKTANGLEAKATVSVYDIVAGTKPLSEIITEKNLAEATSLKVGGTLTNDDFKALNAMTHLETLDLTATSNTAIPANAFANNKPIRTLLLSDNVKSIGDQALSSMGIVKFDMPDSVETLAGNVFFASTSLEELHLSEKLTSIPAGTVYYCMSLKTVNIPAGVETIGTMAFNWCNSLILEDKTLVIPDSVKKISKDAFGYCGAAFNKVVLGNNVEYIGMNAFQKTVGEAEIESIILPASLKKLSDSAFPKAKEVTFKGEVPPEFIVTLSPSDNTPVSPTNTMKNAIVNVPAAAEEAYRNSVWFQGTDAYKRDNGNGTFTNPHIDLYDVNNLKTF